MSKDFLSLICYYDKGIFFLNKEVGGYEKDFWRRSFDYSGDENNICVCAVIVFGLGFESKPTVVG